MIINSIPCLFNVECVFKLHVYNSIVVYKHALSLILPAVEKATRSLFWCQVNSLNFVYWGKSSHHFFIFLNYYRFLLHYVAILKAIYYIVVDFKSNSHLDCGFLLQSIFLCLEHTYLFSLKRMKLYLFSIIYFFQV